MVQDNFEVLTPTEVDATFSDTDPTDTPAKVRKLCACGCGEEVSGNRALKRGHTMGEGLSASVFGGNDIIVFQAAFVTLVAALSAGAENLFQIPKMEQEESQAIGEPLGRIAARHIPKALLKRMKPGDAADAIAIITVMSAYVIRVTTTPKDKKEIPVATNGYIPDQGVSGLNQYGYRPPVQSFQSQDDRTN